MTGETSGRRGRSRGIAIGLAIFLLAASVRLSLISNARFSGDESQFYAIAREVAAGRVFPTMGPPLSGGSARHPGGGFFLLMAMSQLVARSPESANAWVALLGAASVWLFWSAMRSVDRSGATIAAFLMACSPWSVLYADRIWNSNVVGLFVALAFWASMQIRARPSSRWAALLVFACAVMPQFHMSAPAYWSAIAALIGFRRINLRWAAIGGLAAVVAYMPYLVSEVKSGFENGSRIRGESAAMPARVPYELPVAVARLATLDASFHEIGGLTKPAREGDLFQIALFGSRARPFHPLRATALGVSILLAAWGVVSAARRTEFRPFLRALLVGVAADAILLGWSGKVVFPHYAQPLLPFVFALFAAWTPRPVVLIGVAIFAAGSLDVVGNISTKLDAREGLVVHRRVVELLEAEGRVRMGLGFLGSVESYNVLSRYDYGGSVRFGNEGATYFLVENGWTPPRGVASMDVEGLGPVELVPRERIGPVTLFGVRQVAPAR